MTFSGADSSNLNSLVAEVAVDGAFASSSRGLLSYEVPPALAERAVRGAMVWVPLRTQLTLGVIMEIRERADEAELRPIEAVVEIDFVLSDAHLASIEWLARETCSTLYAAAAPFFPPGISHRTVEHLSLTERGRSADGTAFTAAQAKLIDYLRDREVVTLDAARTALNSSLTSVVPKLVAAGVIERSVRVIDSAPESRPQRYLRLVGYDAQALERSPKQQAVVDFFVQRQRLAAANEPVMIPMADLLERTGTDRSAVVALTRKGILEEQLLAHPPRQRIVEERSAPNLTESQAAAWREISDSLEGRDSRPILLHGVTGSGKTELYLRAVAWCLRRERSAIILVPEIALASQVVRRFQARFPGQVAVLHSALPDRDRYATWRAVAAGDLRVVVGPRSALFAPVDNLGLIVLDEEHEGAYKQESEPRYRADALARRLATQANATLILGSATPSVESMWRATRGEYRRVSLPDRVGQRRDGDAQATTLELPPVEVVDMRLELHRGQASIISERLREVLGTTLARREQSILFLNRRGLATVVLCRSCGTVLTCPNCDIPLVYHQDRACLLCHRCNHREPQRNRCPECLGALNYFGAGTQRVEEEVKRLFPNARVARWDQDSVRKRGGHERLLHAVERREIDIIVGTQMIAKGLDLPMVTAIGVINADTMVHLPDFRAGERTFQLLTQVAGRAGRRTAGSTVVIQSYSPSHYAIDAASRHDYQTFYTEEIDFRQRHRYPPYSRLVRYLYRHPKEENCAAEADEMARELARFARSRRVEIDLIGPTPAFATRVRGKFQWHIVLRAAPDDLELLLDGLPVHPGWTVDVDPQSLL
jgi:primosomal protein N' (replication factor Y)